MNDRPPPRRPEFDALAQGWGSDGEVDLAGRLELLGLWTAENGPLTAAEQKIIAAMQRRLGALAEGA